MKLVIIGHWAFLIGLILSIIAGFGGIIPNLIGILFVLGLIVGFLNVGEKESTAFLVAVIALLLIGVAGLQLGGFIGVIAGILANLIAFVSAAGLVVAVKQVLCITRRLE